MNDLIFISMENWDDVWRRNQFVCPELARRNPHNKILFVGLPRDFSNRLRRGHVSELIARNTYPAPGFNNILITHPIKLFPNSLPIGRKLNDSLFRRSVRRAARKFRLTNPLLWLNPHSAVHMVGKMKECGVVYDITDDWTTLTQSSKLRRLTIDQDYKLCSIADAVIVCSPTLFELKHSLAHHLNLIPNGVDASHYRSVLDGPFHLPPAAHLWPKPILGYTGTIHPDRVDVGLIESLAKEFEQGSIVLVGPNHLMGSDLKHLTRPNIKFTDAVPYSEVPRFMQAFDVCIAPHRVTPFTESLNPIKLWEYLAAGKPIVSTPIAGFRDYPNFVRLASDSNAFIAAVREALTEDRATQELRRQQVADHSWKSRVDAIEQVLAGVEKRRVKPITAMNPCPVPP